MSQAVTTSNSDQNHQQPLQIETNEENDEGIVQATQQQCNRYYANTSGVIPVDADDDEDVNVGDNLDADCDDDDDVDVDDGNCDSLGPLPPKWEKAYTDNGEVYFIDHLSGTSHWLDPRLSKFQKKSLADCLDDELPYGWEKINDPNYGVYFIDHVNRRTQYENPVLLAKRAASQAAIVGSGSGGRSKRMPFTKIPTELCGEMLRTTLVKSARGLGFTIVGGDDAVDEFLQIKSVVSKGPAWYDGKLQMGDVIVYVNDICVLGYSHIQIVRLFQSIHVGTAVALVVCRGYPLPFDPNDPNTEVVTTIAVDDYPHIGSSSGSSSSGQPNSNNCSPKKQSHYHRHHHFDGQHQQHQHGRSTDEIDTLMHSVNNCHLNGHNNVIVIKVGIVKGNLGFGFTIADSACGQRVKQILDRQRCKNLLEGDILVAINEIILDGMSHDEVVQVLKNCPYNSEATICVHRGGYMGNMKSTKFEQNNKDLMVYRSKTPTADLYSTQPREILPNRPKTPLVSYPCHNNSNNNNGKSGLPPLPPLPPPPPTASSTKSIDGNSNGNHLEMIPPQSCIDVNSVGGGSGGNLMGPSNCDEYQSTVVSNGVDKWDMMSPYHTYTCNCTYCMGLRMMDYGEETISNDCQNHNNSNHIKQNDVDYDDYLLRYTMDNPNNNCVTTAIVLQRQQSGFGFRIIGGIEDKSQVTVGHIVPDGAADLDGRMQTGDEILSVDGYIVVKASHRQVVHLMSIAANRGQVSLIVRRQHAYSNGVRNSEGRDTVDYPTVSNHHQHHYRTDDASTAVHWPIDDSTTSTTHPHHMLNENLTMRPMDGSPAPTYTDYNNSYIVTVNRQENEGFGFVIISSANKDGSKIGRLIEGSPAACCGKLGVGDYIIAVNHTSIVNLGHSDVVNLVKESGLSVTLTVVPADNNFCK